MVMLSQMQTLQLSVPVAVMQHGTVDPVATLDIVTQMGVGSLLQQRKR